ncbi:MAG TPA: FAD-dependent oxidoreductase [Spirochaetota bacterium]|nr:FAD-dependent oxidoreductase [Spirochaetota bacterium]
MNHIVIIGLGSAGYAALMSIRRTAPKSRITVIDPKLTDLMHPCGIPYSLGGHVPAAGLEQDILLSKMGVKKLAGEAVRIDADSRTITMHAGDGERAIAFDAAIIATGSVPAIPAIAGMERALYNGLYPLATVDDLKKIKDRLDSAVRGVVIGAGAIGLEAAIALRKHLKTIYLFEMKPQVLPGILDPDMSVPVREHMELHGVVMNAGASVDGILSDAGFAGVTSGEKAYEAEIGILAAGFRADTDLAAGSGIAFEPLGITVDERMRTSVPGVFAAGDCIAAWSVIDGARVPVKLATCAYRQGVVAGINASGGDVAYRGTAATFVTKVGKLEVAGTGYTTEAAKGAGYTPVEGKIRTGILPEYFPGNTEISLKVICDRDSGRFLGAQAVAENGAAGRINLVSMALDAGVMPADFWRVELAYCPAVSKVIDPLNRAVEFALRRIAR